MDLMVSTSKPLLLSVTVWFLLKYKWYGGNFETKDPISPPQHRVEILELLEAVEVAGSAPEAAKGPPQHLGLGLGGGRVRAGEVLLGEALPGQSCNTRGFEI